MRFLDGTAGLDGRALPLRAGSSQAHPKVAVVTDAALGNLAEKLASHFMSATIRHFPAGKVEAAKQWIMSKTPVS
jgi:SpoIIAA-like